VRSPQGHVVEAQLAVLDEPHHGDGEKQRYRLLKPLRISPFCSKRR
jgi:hypothetical protein